MSIQASYKISKTPHPNAFLFKSIGVKGEIVKVVLFQKMEEENRFNLAFGDLDGDDFDDKVISNNNDLVKVISTVVKTIYYFFELNPNAIVEIHGVDEKRKRLYNSIFKRRRKEIEKVFLVRGEISGQWVKFLNEQNFERFEIRLKK